MKTIGNCTKGGEVTAPSQGVENQAPASGAKLTRRQIFDIGAVVGAFVLTVGTVGFIAIKKVLS